MHCIVSRLASISRVGKGIALEQGLSTRVSGPGSVRTVLSRAQDVLLDTLQHQLDAAIVAPTGGRGDAIREFACKAEEVHVTLRKHLRKEEEQLFPLVLQHFTFREQADLVVRRCRRAVVRCASVACLCAAKADAVVEIVPESWLMRARVEKSR